MQPEAHVYRRVDGRALELEIAAPEKRDPAAAAVIFFHGGAWRIGSREQFRPQCARLAERGAFGVSVSYRLVSDENGLDPTACVDDAESALLWVREHAPELGIDRGRIVLAGGSAGGQLAAAVASRGHALAALVLFNPALAPDGSADLKFMGERGRYPFAGPPPPSLVVHGKADTTIPIENSRRFRERLESQGVRCELVEYPDMPHAFFNFRAPEGRYDETLAEMERFLDSLGLLAS